MRESRAMFTKKFLKTKCKVTFELPEALTENAQSAHLVGDFNNWDEQATPMEKKDGRYTVTLDLDLNRDYQYRYLVNTSEWHNDWHADRYVPNPYFGDNSVISTNSEAQETATNGTGAKKTTRKKAEPAVEASADASAEVPKAKRTTKKADTAEGEAPKAKRSSKRNTPENA
jgi:hypothetical protein